MTTRRRSPAPRGKARAFGAHEVGAPGGTSALVLELPIIAPGTQAYTCSVSCAGRCCKYYSMPMDTPRSDRDFDDIRWYLMHEDTNVYKYEGTWYLLVNRRCKYLRPDNLCGIYDTRPAICREYDAVDCEFTGEVPYELFFADDVALEKWLAARKERRSKTRAKSARPASRRTKAPTKRAAARAR